MRTLLLASLFISASAMACPDLSGTYATCRSTTGASTPSSDLVVTQSVSNGVTTYSMTQTDDESQERTTDLVAADGKVITAEESMGEGVVMVINTTYSCTDTALVGNVDFAIKMEGGSPENMGQVKMDVVKNGNQLVMTMNGDVMGEPMADVMICE